MTNNQLKAKTNSSNVITFAENNLSELVGILMNEKRSESLFTALNLLPGKKVSKNETLRQAFSQFLNGISMQGYITHLLATKTFLNKFGREKLSEFILNNDRADLRLRKNVF
jgi:hypothetical protein